MSTVLLPSGTKPKPPSLRLLGAVLIAISVCFAGILYLRRLEAEHLFAAGFSLWGNTGFYIRVIPGHSISLVQQYTTDGNIADAFVPSMMAGLAAFLLFILWFSRLAFVKRPKRAVGVLLPLVVISAYIFYGICVVVAPPPRVTINLDTKTISSSELGPSPINQIGGFACAIVQGNKSSWWEIGLHTVNGRGYGILPVRAVPAFPGYNAIPQLIARTLSDFIVSHGTQLPKNVIQS